MTNFPNWKDFTAALCQEFGPSELEDSAENLVKLRQSGTLRDYVMEFRRLANRTLDISPSLLKSCFIGGLRPKRRHDVKLLKPRDVLEAAAFAHQIDAKLTELKAKSGTKASLVQSNFRIPFQNVNSNSPVANPAKPINVRRLTPEEVDYCRKNGLCFHCKEKYVRGHSCERKQLLLIDVQDSESGDNVDRR